MILFIFGDSITQGYWDDKGGWADRVKASVLAKDIAHGFSSYHGVHNLGIDGNTTRQVIDRFEHEMQARLWPGSDYGVIFSVGTNDTVFRAQGDFDSTPERYREELAILSQQARKLTPRVAFLNLCPVDEALTNPLPNSSTGKCYTNERIDKFNEALRDFCETNGLTLIDIHSQFTQHDNILADGLHPNSDGHQIIVESVLPTVESWLYGE